MQLNNSNNFPSSSSTQSFSDKQKDLFAQLEDAEKKYGKNLTQQLNTETYLRSAHSEERFESNKSKSSYKQYKSRESIFKRPDAPINRCLPHGRIPDFRKNPQKWTKYSLKDVKEEDMSDRGNSRAAFDFLKRLENKNNATDEMDIDGNKESKITFKKSVIAKRKNDCNIDISKKDDKISFRSSKIVMPEYVVGQKVQKRKIKQNDHQSNVNNSKKSSGLKLDHLLQEESDDNED